MRKLSCWLQGIVVVNPEPPRRHQFRFFVRPDHIMGDVVLFPTAVSRQMAQVLRLKSGNRVIVLDGTGAEHLVELRSIDKEAVGDIISTGINVGEPAARIYVYPALLKGKKLDLVFQKCTELGVASIAPVQSRRSVADPPSSSRTSRYHDIVREAAEQAGRGRLPTVGEAVALEAALASAPRHSLVFSAGPASLGSLAELSADEWPAGREISIGVFIGPEGGFTDDELALAQSYGHRVVGLGPLTLRAETAAIVATGLVIHYTEQLRH